MGLCLSMNLKSKPPKCISSQSISGSSRWTRIRSRKENFDNSSIEDQALEAAMLFQQLQNGGGFGGSVPFDRSSSMKHTSGNSKKQLGLPRSSSSRARSLTDPLLQPHQLHNQDVKLDGVETNHIVLVHGGGFGAWFWYKTIALLEEGEFRVTATDLTGSAIHFLDTNNITSLSQYVKPLIDFLGMLPGGESSISKIWTEHKSRCTKRVYGPHQWQTLRMKLAMWRGNIANLSPPFKLTRFLMMAPRLIKG